MANPTFYLSIDVITGQVLGGSVVGGNVIPIIKNDVYDVVLYFVESSFSALSPNNTKYSPYLANGTIKFAIGDIDEPPSSGSFRLSCNGVTSTNIAYNATPAQVYSAISNNVSTVNSYGRGYLLVASQPNTAMSFGADTGLLFPSSSAIISTRLNPSSSVTAQQTILLTRNPYVFVDNFVSNTTSVPFTLQKLSYVSGNTSYEVTNAKDISPESTFSLSFDGNSTNDLPASYLKSNGIAVLNPILRDTFGTNAVTKYRNTTTSFRGQQVYSGVTAYLDYAPNVRAYNILDRTIISLEGKYLNTNVTTPMELRSQVAVVDTGRKIATVTFSTAGIEDLFANASGDSVQSTLEIEIVENGNPRTVLQTPIILKKDLIVAGSSLPAAIQQYYTKTETDAIFVEDSVSNVDASNRKLANAAGIATVDYGQGIFGASGMVNMASSAITVGGFPVYIASSVTATGAVSFGGGMAVSGNLGFYGTSPIAKPSGANAISNVISLGLIASSSTYGVWPGSIKTLTTSVTLTFGNVAANDTTSVTTTITGSNINDIVLLGLPNSLCAGLSFYGHVTTADVVEIDAVNGINSSRDQSAQTYRITVVGY